MNWLHSGSEMADGRYRVADECFYLISLPGLPWAAHCVSPVDLGRFVLGDLSCSVCRSG